jgi:hypothetical protein
VPGQWHAAGVTGRVAGTGTPMPAP